MMIMGMKQNVVSLMIKTILPYVLEVVRNTAMDELRRKQRQRGRFLRDGDEALLLYPDPAALEEKVLMRETMAAVRRAIAELPEKEQQVLRLKVLENRTDAEIAAETGLSPGSIRQYLHRARGRLREKLF